MHCMQKTIVVTMAAIVVGLSGSACTADRADEAAPPVAATYLPLVKSHLDRIIGSGTDRFGPVRTAMWCANIDTRTGEPLDDSHVPERVYRLIGAPGGSTLYWDQPLVASACILSEITGEAKYADAVREYIADFLEHCVDQQGMFVWGNHQYYDVYGDSLVYFHGGYHEMRPLTPAWELFWRQDSARCSRYIREMVDRQVYDRQTGGFNRHDDGRAEHPFIEAGAVLVETLAWLYHKEQDPELLALALRVAEFTYSHRGEQTGLVRSSPGSGRWDDYTATTEIGLWAQALLRAAEYTSDDRFTEMAGDAVRAYLKYGYDKESGLYFGQLNTDDGTPRTPDSKGYWPGKYSDIWNTDQWPTHDYPMNFAEACLGLYSATGEETFLEGVRRWIGVVEKQSAPGGIRPSYAENYGRCIRFLTRAGAALGSREPLELAARLADKAADRLYENGMFQGFPDSHVYESVDGVGYLCLALIALEHPEAEDYAGFGF